MISFWWIILLLGILGWTSLYWFFSHLNRNKKAEWHCRLVTLIHGTLVSVLSAWNAFVVGPCPLTDLGEPNTREQEVTLAISLSYFLFDQVWCILHKAEGRPPSSLHQASRRFGKGAATSSVLLCTAGCGGVSPSGKYCGNRRKNTPHPPIKVSAGMWTPKTRADCPLLLISTSEKEVQNLCAAVPSGQELKLHFLNTYYRYLKPFDVHCGTFLQCV
ncbi:uncharacterized protein LOC143222527 [Tachypleus tridentatus]|uniref:uncharacterized protein LOC143222527 n=1 Tax=Tachypleus tridentatus TaxID=6853 RepID=UPI003FD4BFA4